MSTAISSPHGRVLEKLIRERRQALLEAFVSTADAMIAFRIQGLDEALRLSEQADYKLNGEE